MCAVREDAIELVTLTARLGRIPPPSFFSSLPSPSLYSGERMGGEEGGREALSKGDLGGPERFSIFISASSDWHPSTNRNLLTNRKVPSVKQPLFLFSLYSSCFPLIKLQVKTRENLEE